MRSISLFIICIFAVVSISAQKTNPNYDAELAKELGADDYGMKSYVFVMLKTGPNNTSDQTFIDSCFAGHMSNMKTMTEAGHLIVAGPMGKNKMSYRGIFILDVETLEEARVILETDPAIKSKLLEAELYEWYGSAALREYHKSSDKVWKIGF